MMEKKAFVPNPKHQYHVSQCGEHDCYVNNKENGDYYEYPSLSPFSNKLRLKGKWWKEKLFLQIQKQQYRVSHYREHDCNANN